MRSVGRDSNGDPDAPDACFLCVQEGKRGRLWDNKEKRYLDYYAMLQLAEQRELQREKGKDGNTIGR